MSSNNLLRSTHVIHALTGKTTETFKTTQEDRGGFLKIYMMNTTSVLMSKVCHI